MAPFDLPFLNNNTAPRIVPNLPRATEAFTNKYADTKFRPFYSTLPTPVRNSLVNYDMKRVNRGQTPLPIADTIKAVAAARDRKASTESASPNPFNIVGNAIRNVKDLAAGVIRTPVALYEEGRDIIQTGPQRFQEALGAGNPFEVIEELSDVPGIRFLPGSYAVGNIAEGPEGWKELASNPLFTALDVLPGVNKLAEASPVAKAYSAQKAALEGAGKFAPDMNPIRANMAYRLTEEGLQPRAITQVARAIGDTAPGQWVNSAFSQQSRAGARIAGEMDVEYKNMISPDGLPVEGNLGPVVEVARRAQRLSTDLNLDNNQVAEATRVMQFAPDKIASLTPDQQSFISTIRDEFNPRLLEYYADLPDGLMDVGGEIYEHSIGMRLNAAETRMGKTVNRINEYVMPKLNAAWQRSGDPRLVRMMNHLENGEFADARRMLSYMGQGKTRLERPQGVTRGKNVPLKDMLPADMSLNQIKNIRDAIHSAASAQRRLDVVTRTSSPARFKPLIGQRAAEQYAKQLASRGAVQINTPEQMTAVAKQIMDRDYIDIPGFDIAELNGMADEIGKTWQTMRDVEGLNPVYVPRFTARKAETLRRAGVLETVPSLNQLKDRMQDISPAVNDAGVAISAQAMQVLSKNVSEAYIRKMIDTFGEDGVTIERKYAPAARIAAEADPRKSFREYMDDYIRRDYGKFSESGIQQYAPAMSNLPENLYLPKIILDNIQQNYNPKTYRLSAVTDPITGLFRTAILPLSPRWHVYNATGNTISTLARGGPTALSYIPAAQRLMRAISHNDVDAMRAAGLPREMRLALGGQLREADEFAFRAGRTQGRLALEAATSRILRSTPGENSPMKLAAAKFKAATDLSYKMNQWVDDLGRVTMFLYGKGKKSMTDKQAVDLVRKTFQQWDEYTPIERQLLRSIFPFYGFTQHIMRFAAKYPFDHPVRASIIGSITRAELEDLGTGLPHAFLNMFTIGGEDENGIVNAISTQGLNPFSDIGNMLTLSGALSATNPVLATLFQQMGVEDGQLELYPTLKLDPVTGRMIPDQGSVLSNFAKNVIPQSEMIAHLFGAGGAMKEMKKTDPASWARTMRSGLGFPILFRTYDMPAEYIKAEVRRQEDQNNAKNRALKSGDYSAANRYPGLEGLMEQVRALSADEIESLTPRYAVPAYESQITGLRG